MNQQTHAGGLASTRAPEPSQQEAHLAAANLTASDVLDRWALAAWASSLPARAANHERSSTLASMPVFDRRTGMPPVLLGVRTPVTSTQSGAG